MLHPAMGTKRMKAHTEHNESCIADCSQIAGKGKRSGKTSIGRGTEQAGLAKGMDHRTTLPAQDIAPKSPAFNEAAVVLEDFLERGRCDPGLNAALYPQGARDPREVESSSLLCR